MDWLGLLERAVELLTLCYCLCWFGRLTNNKDDTNQMHAACSKVVGPNQTFGKSLGTAYMYGHGAKVGPTKV